MDVSVRFPIGLQAICVGRLESHDTAQEPDFDTWHWVARQPVATFTAFVSIGRLVLAEGVGDGLSYVYAVSQQLTRSQQQAALAALRTSAPRVRVLAQMFGPYPFTELAGWSRRTGCPSPGWRTRPAPSKTRPVYDARSILNPDFSSELLTHELAHMWFGDAVTVRQ